MAVRKTVTIAAGSASGAVDLERRYPVILVGCADTDGIDASTTLSAAVDHLGDGDYLDVWFEDGSAIWVSGTLEASDDGTFNFWVRGAFGAQRIQFTLSNNVEAMKSVELIVWGLGAPL